MKVKLKDKKMDSNYGLFRPQMKALNRGEVIEINEIPKDAKPYLDQINEIKKKDADSIRHEILKLINNETIKKDIEENFVFPDIGTKSNLLWTLLTYSGYITTKNELPIIKCINSSLRFIFIIFIYFNIFS